jgi:hypothetical protein
MTASIATVLPTEACAVAASGWRWHMEGTP